MEKTVEFIIDYLEEILILLAFFILNVTLFIYQGVFFGLISLVITLFILAILVIIYKNIASRR